MPFQPCRFLLCGGLSRLFESLFTSIDVVYGNSYLRSGFQTLVDVPIINRMRGAVAMASAGILSGSTSIKDMTVFLNLAREMNWRSKMQYLKAHFTKGLRNAWQMFVYAWNSPEATRASIHARISLGNQRRFARNSSCPCDQCKEDMRIYNEEIAGYILNASLDIHSIVQISTFSARMGMCTISDDGSITFSYALNCRIVVESMHQKKIPAVCISYKHTRRSADELPQDKRRIEQALSDIIRQVDEESILFWCDIIGRTPEGIAWAQQGVDPYLWMPTVRIVSDSLKHEIDDSFWMAVELTAACLRGGMITYYEDTRKLAMPAFEDSNTFVPTLMAEFDICKFLLAKFVCSPHLFYKHARIPEDKLEIMKYAIWYANRSQIGNVVFSQNRHRLVKISERLELMSFLGLTSFGHKQEILGHTKRPTQEIPIADGQPWNAMENSFPPMKVIVRRMREALNDITKYGGGFEVREIPCDIDGESYVLHTPVGPYWGQTLRLRVEDFKVHQTHVTGRVLSFRVGTEAEDQLMKSGTNIRKSLGFNIKGDDQRLDVERFQSFLRPREESGNQQRENMTVDEVIAHLKNLE